MIIRTACQRLLYALLCIVLAPALARGQTFKFADTHPVNNPDSLEQWLTVNPKAPAFVRIKNLIALERTRDWLDRGKMGRHLPALHALAIKTRNPMALAVYEFLIAKKASRSDDLYGATLHGFRALNQFEKLNDVSGQINTRCLLFSIQYDRHGHLTAADSSLTEAHWQQSQTLLAAYPNPHDQVLVNYIAINRAFKRGDKGRQEQLTTNALDYVIATPACAYAQRIFDIMRNGLNYGKGNFRASYAQNKNILTTYPTTDAYELAALYFNLGNDCLQLKRLNEGLTCFENATKFALAASPVRYSVLVPANNNAAVLAARNGLYKKAYAYLASMRLYENKANLLENSRRMQDLQARYESARRQRQIDLLKQKQEIAQLQNKVYTVVLCLAVLVLAAISLLAWRLYQNRQKLQQTNHELTLALADVQQLNKTREHFIALIAHDLRRPLTAFQGLAALISVFLRQGAYDKIQLISSTIDSTGLQLEAMLDNLLRWALNQRESVPYQPQVLPLAEAVSRVVDLYQQLIRFQNMTIVVNCPAQLQVYADPNAIQLIMRNLIDNALKQLGESGRITIDCQANDDATVHVSICDNGRGIEPQRLAFFQQVLASQATGEVGQHGLGLGLLLVRDFVQRNRGQVSVTSELGKGTCFTVNLPAPHEL